MATLNEDEMQIVELNNVEEICVADENVSRDEFCKVLRSVGEDEFCRIVESEFTPYIGQQFDSLEEAVEFYKMYALACGFDVRKYTTKKWRDGTIKSKLLVCNREGFTYKKKVRKNEDEASGSRELVEEVHVGKSRRKNKLRRVGCKARIRLYMKKGVLVIDRFHAGHNHESVEVKDREFQKLSRHLHRHHMGLILNNSRLKIGATRTYKMCKEYVNGFQNIGASVNDFKNFGRDLKCYINPRDGQLFIDRFKSMAETRADFYFDYEQDVDGSLIRIFWADGVGRRNYEVFGDGVAFDPTYSTNKYDMIFTPFTGVDNHKRSVTFCAALIFREKDDYFNWVFSRFLIAMGGKEPEYIITDQDPGIISSVAQIFKKARHRFCMWHIMNKVPVKYGGRANDFPDFIKKLNAIVWDEDIEPEEFDIRWVKIMEEHGVGDEREWFKEIYQKRRQWVMAHCRDLNMGGVMRTTQRSESENSFFKRFENNSGTLVEFWMRYESAIDQQRYTHKMLDNENRQAWPILLTKSPLESHGSKVYTHVVFEEFQEEVNQSTEGLIARGFKVVNGVEVTNIRDSSRDRVYEIHYNPGTQEATCTCRMFERTGILCRHIIMIYSGHGLKKIPDFYVARRWTKDAISHCYDLMDITDLKQIEMTKLWSEVHETVGLLRDRPKADVESLCLLIREFKEKLRPLAVQLTKQQQIEELLGCQSSGEITILPPKKAKTKGSGKRLLSTKTKAAAKNAKPKRMCGNCKEMAHHDRRNCPNPFAERRPESFESSSEESEEEEEIDEEEDDEVE